MVKKIWWAVLFVILLGSISMFSLAAYEENLLTNGDFSDGTNGWTVREGTATLQEDGWLLIKSNREQCTSNTEFASIYQKEVPLQAGRTYRVSVDYKKVDDGAFIDGEGAMINFNVSGTYVYIGKENFLQDQWYTVVKEFTVSSDSLKNVEFRVNTLEYGIRNVKLEDITPSIATDLLLDGVSIGTFDKRVTEYTVQLPYGFQEFPSVSALLNESYSGAVQMLVKEPERESPTAVIRVSYPEKGWSDEYTIHFEEMEQVSFSTPEFHVSDGKISAAVTVTNQSVAAVPAQSYTLIIGTYDENFVNTQLNHTFNPEIPQGGSVQLTVEVKEGTDAAYCFIVDTIETIRPILLPTAGQ